MVHSSRSVLAWSAAVLALAFGVQSTEAPRPGRVAARPETFLFTCSARQLPDGPPVAQHVLVRLPDARAVSIGGITVPAGGAPTTVADVHILGGPPGAWAPLPTTGDGPGAVAGHVAVYADGATAGIVVHGGARPFAVAASGAPSAAPRGGEPPTSEVFGQAYLLSVGATAATWQPLGPPGPARTEHSAIWWAEEQSVIVFGGREGDDPASASGQTWRLRLDGQPAWGLYQNKDGPGPRYGHTAIYDPPNKRMLVFGGTRDGQSALTEMWALDLAHGWDQASWRQIQWGVDSGGRAPAARFDHLAVYSPLPPYMAGMIGQGGTGDGANPADPSLEIASLWVYGAPVERPQWHGLRFTSAMPASSIGAAAAWHPNTNEFLVHGGQRGGQTHGQTWLADCEMWFLEPTSTRTSTAPSTATSTRTPTATPTGTPTPTVPTRTPWPTITVRPTFTPSPIIPTRTTPTRTPTPTPSCTTHTVTFDLSSSASRLRVDEQITITARLANVGCSGIGLPRYRLSWQSGTEGIFEAVTPLDVYHQTGVGVDTAEFVLRARRGGQAALKADVSFEVHLGYPGPAYWGSATTAPLPVDVFFDVRSVVFLPTCDRWAGAGQEPVSWPPVWPSVRYRDHGLRRR